MSKDWQRGSGYVDAPKITKELGVGKECGCCISVTMELIEQKRVESSKPLG